jgi:hypothetical protein
MYAGYLTAVAHPQEAVQHAGRSGNGCGRAPGHHGRRIARCRNHFADLWSETHPFDHPRGCGPLRGHPQGAGRGLLASNPGTNDRLWIEDLAKAQKFSDRFSALDWPGLLTRYAKKINPLFNDLLKPMQYYWVTAQSEYSTDVLFKSSGPLDELFPRLLSHSTMCFGAKQVMGFLGRKLRGNFEGDIVSDVTDFSHRRLPGIRIKHRVKQNWLKRT